MFTHKNLMTVCCAAVLAFGLAACGSNGSDDEVAATTPTTPMMDGDMDGDAMDGDTDSMPPDGDDRCHGRFDARCQDAGTKSSPTSRKPRSMAAASRR